MNNDRSVRIALERIGCFSKMINKNKYLNILKGRNTELTKPEEKQNKEREPWLNIDNKLDLGGQKRWF